MKFVAFILALVLGIGVWMFPTGLILMGLKANGSPGALVFFLLATALIFIVKKFYKFFLKKFGYEVIEKNQNDEIKNIK